MPMNRFDLVVITEIKNVIYLSGPSGRPATPQGTWIVTYVFEDDTILLSKDDTIVRIPVKDTTLVGRYEVENVIRKLRGMNDSFVGEKHGETKSNNQ